MYRGTCGRCKTPITYVINRPKFSAVPVDPDRGRWVHDGDHGSPHRIVATEVTPV